MRAHCWVHSTLGTLILCSGVLFASETRSEKALWIEVKERGEQKTTVAMTVGIARELLESKETKVNFAEEGEKELITKDMLQAILDGRQEFIEAHDNENATEAKLYLKQLEIPGKESGKNRLVLEVSKSGMKTFRIALPEIEVEKSGEKSEGSELERISFGWKGLLPFLAKEGGAVYIQVQKDDTEVWIYVE